MNVSGDEGRAIDSRTTLARETEVQEAVRRIAAGIRRDHDPEQVTLVGIMDGALIFLADLARELSPVTAVTTMRVRSYDGDQPGPVEVLWSPDPAAIEGRSVVLVDTVVETSATLRAAVKAIRAAGSPSHIHLAALIDKGGLGASSTLLLDGHYVGWTMPGAPYIVGYGLDFRGRGRGLRSIDALKS